MQSQCSILRGSGRRVIKTTVPASRQTRRICPKHGPKLLERKIKILAD